MGRLIFTILCFALLVWLLFGNGAAAAGGLLAGLGWATIFVIGSIGFWVLMVSACIALCIADEHESGVGATATVLITLLLLHLCGGFHPWPWITTHWWTAAIGFPAYFAFGGGAWAVFMLRRRAREELERYEKTFDAYLSSCRAKSEGDLTDAQRTEWLAQRKRSGFAIDKKISDYKALILYWICYWPPSLVWYFISDFVKEIADEIFRRLQGYYQRIWDDVWKNARGSFRGAASN
ncbi:MAG: hypothetical protein HY922_15320 [Elusimicrobia bacterium]|nr:hypothetical protein [Elusimicrobiota bacterium]